MLNHKIYTTSLTSQRCPICMEQSWSQGYLQKLWVDLQSNAFEQCSLASTGKTTVRNVLSLPLSDILTCVNLNIPNKILHQLCTKRCLLKFRVQAPLLHWEATVKTFFVMENTSLHSCKAVHWFFKNIHQILSQE